MATRRIVIGLNSGTSADGVDAAACEIKGRGLAMRVRLLGFVHRAYPEALRERLLAIMAPATTRTEELCLLEVEVGRAFADAAAAVVRKLRLRRVDLIGSHGQTICHLPPLPSRERVGERVRTPNVHGTLQIGDASLIAARMNCPVAHHFRQADMAVGGQGAPLVPWTDYVLFGHSKKNRIIQNIGGISNLTWLPAKGKPDDVIAFDMGPGNMVIDTLVRIATKGRETFDRDGQRAARGQFHVALLDAMTRHPFLAAFPPKSCGRDEFGEAWVRGLMKRFARSRIKPADWITTAYHFFGCCCMMAYGQLKALAGERSKFDEIILCGGGAENPRLVLNVDAMASGIELILPKSVPIKTTADYGIPTQAKESVSFAMLAAACADRVPANLPRVTGASRRVVLGHITGDRARS